MFFFLHLIGSGNKITKGNGHLLLIPIQSELASFASAIVH